MKIRQPNLSCAIKKKHTEEIYTATKVNTNGEMQNIQKNGVRDRQTDNAFEQPRWRDRDKRERKRDKTDEIQISNKFYALH